jgi:hypothetical protein
VAERPAAETEPHPCAVAWDDLARINEALEAAWAAGADPLYQVALLETEHRARVYLEALGKLIEERRR